MVLLALALQTAAGVLEPGLVTRCGHIEQARQVAQAMVRRIERVVRKQDEKPHVARNARVVRSVDRAEAPEACAGLADGVRRPGNHLIDLPPPVAA